MTDLILHIGLPKTGTTSIQSQFFAGRINYLGQDSQNRCISSSNTEAKELRKLLKDFLWKSFRHNEKQAHYWAHRCSELLQTSFISSENWPHTVILSDENLSKWPSSLYKGSYFPIVSGLLNKSDFKRYRPAPIIRLLRDHGQTLWPFGKIRVVITIRNQADWLASLYSQESDKISNASNVDFEKQVKKIISTDDPYLHWLYWIEDLEYVLGDEKLLVLPIEEMHTSKFWMDFECFLGTHSFTYVDFNHFTDKFENIGKGHYPDSWKIKSLNVRRSISQDQKINHKFDLFLFVKKLDFIHFFISFQASKNRDSLLYLDDKLKNSIKRHYAITNRSLSHKLNKDLHAFNYF